MKSNSTLLIVLAVAAVAGLWFVLGSGDSPRPKPNGPLAPETSEPGPSGPVDLARGDLPAVEENRRTAVSTDLGAATDTARESRPTLQVTGRVVDSAGGPVGGAHIALFARRDPRAMFEAGRRPGSFEDMRTLMAAETAGPSATTDADGRYALDGRAFASSFLELAVSHPQFAPELVRRPWSVDVGRAVELEDVVLDGGAVVRGRAVDSSGNGVPGAQVRVQTARAFNADARGGRGGGRGNPFARMIARAAPESDPAAALGGSTETDTNGYFSIERVPAGSLFLRAEAPRHVPGELDDIEAETGKEIDVGDVTLDTGTEIRGRVIDPAGAPVADAEVSAGASRNAGRDGRDSRNAAANPDLRSAIRRMGRYRQSARTDTEGRFALDMVPAVPLQVSVTHPEFVDLELDPVEPDPARELELHVEERPSLMGTVVDRHTGNPVEVYGIRARRAPGGNDWTQGMRGRDGASQDPERQARFEALIAERRASQEREQAYREQRLGGIGVIPGRTPDASRHADGRFVLDDLQPGEYVVDVDAPGYVRVAAGRFTLSSDAPNPEVLVQIERGTVVSGRVLDARTKDPVTDARIAMALPPLDGDAAPQARGGFGMFGGRGGRGGRGNRVAEVRTASDGSYEFPPVRPGPFALTIQATDYPDQHDPAFVVQASPAEQRADFALDPGARVYGVVLDMEEDSQLRLQFSHLESRERRTTEVDAATGAYEILGLRSGGYLVQVQQRGGGRNDWRARVGGEIAARTGTDPDLFIPAGGDVRYDVGVDALQFGTVRGRVYRNGEAADGLEVRLAAVDDGTTTEGGGRIRRGISRLLSARVSADDGSFEISSIPPGQYQLEVHARSGGGGARRAANGAMHAEPIIVSRGGTPIERMIEVIAGTLAMRVTGPDGEPVERGRVTLALALEVGNDSAPADWRAAESYLRFGVRDGEVHAENVAPGAYRFAVDAQGSVTSLGDVTVMAHSGPATPLVIVLEPRPPESDSR